MVVRTVIATHEPTAHQAFSDLVGFFGHSGNNVTNRGGPPGAG